MRTQYSRNFAILRVIRAGWITVGWKIRMTEMRVSLYALLHAKCVSWLRVGTPKKIASSRVQCNSCTLLVRDAIVYLLLQISECAISEPSVIRANSLQRAAGCCIGCHGATKCLFWRWLFHREKRLDEFKAAKSKRKVSRILLTMIISLQALIFLTW